MTELTEAFISRVFLTYRGTLLRQVPSCPLILRRDADVPLDAC